MKKIFQKICGHLMDYVSEIVEADTVTIIRFHGDIDSQTIPCIQFNLEDKIEEYLSKDILLDFSDVNRVDSSTLAALLIILDRLNEHNHQLALININEQLESHLKIEGLLGKVQIYANEKEALKALNQKN